ncbi:MAG: TIGR02757 family protein [Elusimicrobia bacterium]|nr:TIGR02757 family protein [Elusimicrobiota bacterium]
MADRKPHYAAALEQLYKRYNKREYVHPDPLEFLYRFDDVRDRELAGLVAASLAYGNVRQILKSVDKTLAAMGKSPRRYVEKTPAKTLLSDFSSFKHRFTTGAEMAALLNNAAAAVKKYGSLHACALEHHAQGGGGRGAALRGLAAELRPGAPTLIPDPQASSALKRLNLYFRWMVRSDNVDPGGWDGLPPSALLVPLDTHMHRIARMLCLTARNPADMKTAVEITSAFAAYAPEDPVKYDFCLTRFGINDAFDKDALAGCFKR